MRAARNSGSVERGAGLVHHRVGATYESHVPLGLFRRRLLPQVGRVAVEPAQVALVDGLDVVADRTVVAARVPGVCQCRRQFQLLGDLRAGESLVEQAEGLVVQVGIQVPLLGQEPDDPLVPPGRVEVVWPSPAPT